MSSYVRLRFLSMGKPSGAVFCSIDRFGCMLPIHHYVLIHSHSYDVVIMGPRFPESCNDVLLFLSELITNNIVVVIDNVHEIVRMHLGNGVQ